MFSTGLSSGAREGRRIMVMLLGTARAAVVCHPARSSSRTAWALDLAAWLGLVPRQATTGGKPRLLGIIKRGNTYLRMLLIHGARAALPSLTASQSPMGEWLRGLVGRAHKNKVVVALAGKLARIAWAVLRSGKDYAAQGDQPAGNRLTRDRLSA